MSTKNTRALVGERSIGQVIRKPSQELKKRMVRPSKDMRPIKKTER